MEYTTVPLPQDPNRHLPSVHEKGIAIFIDCHPGYWLEADNGLRFQVDPNPITNDFPLYPVHGPRKFPDPSHNAYYYSGFRPGGPPIMADAYLSSQPVAYALYHSVHARDVIYQEHRRREPKVDLEEMWHSAVTRFNTSLAQSAQHQYPQTQEVYHCAEAYYCHTPQRTYHYQYPPHENTSSVTVTPLTPSTTSFQRNYQQQQQQQARIQHQQPRLLLPRPEWHPPPQTTGPEIVAVQFANVAAHTAKCDKCDRRNKNGMVRCLSCGWQCCRLCLEAKGGDRSHHYLGTLHTPASEVSASVVVQQRHISTPTPTPTTTTGAGGGASTADDSLGSEPSDLTRTSDLSSLSATPPSGSGSRDVSSASGGGDASGTSGELPEPTDLDYARPDESMDTEETLSWTSHSSVEDEQRAKSRRVRRNPGRRARFSSSMTADSN